MNIFTKIKFFWRKPKVVIIAGNGRQAAKEAIWQVLSRYFKIGKDVLIFEAEPEDAEKLKFLIKKSSAPVLVVTHIGGIPSESDRDFFTGDKEKTIEFRKLAKILPTYGFLVLNFDDEAVREIKNETNSKELTFGFQEGADFQATDINVQENNTNFKINYKGNVVPFWLEKPFGKEQIYAALSAAAVGTAFNLNLIEISQALKNYHYSPM